MEGWARAVAAYSDKATKILRILRVIRVLRVLKLARSAMRDVNDSKTGQTNPIVANLRIYLIALFSIMMISSTLMYYVEGGLYTTEALTEGQAHLDEALVKVKALLIYWTRSIGMNTRPGNGESVGLNSEA